MAEFLANLVSPILTPMGVSTADMVVYIHQLGGYLAVLGIALGLMLAVLIGAHWIKKGWRAFARLQPVLCFLAVAVIVVNLICTARCMARCPPF